MKSKSQMLAVPAQYSDIEDPDLLEKRLRETSAFSLSSFDLENDSMLFEIIYEQESFQVEIYPMDFSLPELYRCQHLFPDVDVDAIQRAQYGLAVEMEFGENPLSSYHLQLKLIHVLLPDALAIIDDSSEKILSGRWVALAAESAVPPAPRYLFTAQAVSGDEEDACVWLHTHGLKRCGRPELEVLNSTRDNYQQHYNVLETLANRLLEEEEPLSYGAPFFFAYVAAETPLVVTLIDWQEAVKLYPEDMLGGKNDRQEGHNQDTCVVFVYPSQESLDEGRFSSLSIYDDLLKDNPIFMISNEETARMRAQATERISYFFNAFGQKDNKLLVKLGLLVDEEHRKQEDDREHIWFEVLDISNGRMTAKLTQEPYYIKDLHAGYEGTYGPEDVTDWLIFTPERRISPDDVYLFTL
ncbi:MAG: DUF4026 domain-containing protein [Lachnospiraceae bacterium]|nr:DUF4026 domain-containing protein [Lachnospiraceae bacterium]